MSNALRRLGLLLGAALATMALAAPAALATNPDFPHGDYEADNWSGGAVWQSRVEDGGKVTEQCDMFPEEAEMEGYPESCPISFVTQKEFPFNPQTDWSDWYLTADWHSSGEVSAPCELEMSGSISFDGQITITEATTGEPPTWTNYCSSKQLRVEDLPWSGSVCSYLGPEGEGEFWLRLEPRLAWMSLPVEGTTFGKLSGGAGPGILADSVEFDEANIGGSDPFREHRHDGVFNFIDEAQGARTLNVSQLENYSEGGLVGCGWPELS